MPPMICILGNNKAAKTRLMEALIKDLKNRGLSVGALKYHKHGDFEIDIEGKDTWKYAMAGAETVAITSSVKFALVKNIKVPTNIEEICEKYFGDNDIVLADGFTLSDKPRIIVVEKKEDAAIFERGCRVISVTDGNIENIGAVIDNILGFLNEP
ncbi:MAG: molybdopterin-guanine dinucleotide biosynthesis protein B [Candidatus Methanoperedens sp.]|nr:molybdopterin-guanine dinucleotide biosynthesis protein B [Candidatus Methanoperedens sp.]